MNKPSSPPPASTIFAGATSVFKALNFELFAKPTNFNLVLSAFGTGAFVSILGYMAYEKHRLSQQQQPRQHQPRQRK